MGGTRTAPDEGLGPLQLPLAELCCVNTECLDVGKRDHGNLSVRTGKGGGRWRVLRCATCKTEFSERKGTALFGTMMDPSRIEAVAAHLTEGCGIQKTARLTGASKSGVTSIALRLGLHARAVHNERVRDLEVNEAQFDEKWAFVGKKQKICDSADPEDQNKGDQWDHTALDVDSRMVVSLVVGKRSRENLEAVVADFADRTGGAPPP
jgi:hypothetical protein